MLTLISQVLCSHDIRLAASGILSAVPASEQAPRVTAAIMTAGAKRVSCVREERTLLEAELLLGSMVLKKQVGN